MNELNKTMCMNLCSVGFCLLLVACSSSDTAQDIVYDTQEHAFPNFSRHQFEVFSDDGAQTNAWGDYDSDGDLDLYVGFRGRANRLYQNTDGTFTDIASQVGLADEEETRAVAWGDYDSDGDLDLYVGFTSDPTTHNKLYENQNNGEYFRDVSDSQGMNRSGTTRQPSFIDYDGDGDLDLFVAFRDQPNRLYRNDLQAFVDVTDISGIGDSRRTVGAAWFDADGDGDLDLFTANQNGDEDGFYLNLGNGSFEDVGADLGINQPGRTATQGSVGVAVGDYDNDGDLDLYVASYGPDLIWENQNDTLGFIKISSGEGFDGDHHSVAATFADYDNDGWLDLYVGTFISTIAEEPDYLFKNVHGDFHIVTPSLLLEKGTSHGIAWADYDGDGDVDLAVANNHAEGTHTLYRNELGPERARKSLQLAILDNQGRWTRAGATVTLSASTWNHSMEGQPSYVSSRVVDTGGGYSSQGATPVHFGIPSGIELVDLTIRWYENGMNIQTVSNLDHSLYADRIFEIRLHPTP
jgi:hypothetical protein